MATLNWTDTLVLGFAPIDDLHRSLVEQMAQVERCPDALLVLEWEHLVDCAQTLFDRENTWMKNTHFSSESNHSLQHRVVLNVLREGLAMARTGQHAQVRQMAGELARWFAKHIQSLDAALALHLRSHPEECTRTLH